jgi:hypothetical protein
MSALPLKIALLLDSLELLMLFVGPLTHFDTKRFLLIMFYNDKLLSIKILIVFNVCIKIHLFSPIAKCST